MKKLLLICILLLILISGCSESRLEGNESSPQNETKPPEKEPPEIKPPEVKEPENNAPEIPVGSENDGADTMEAVLLPVEIEQNCVGFLVGDTRESETIKNIGGGWAILPPWAFLMGNN